MMVENSRQAKPYVWPVVALGAAAVVWSILRLPAASVGENFLLLTLVTLSFGTRLVLKVPRVAAYVPVSDLFVFLAVFLFDGEAAVLLAALVAIPAALGFSRRLSTLLSASARAALTLALSVLAIRLFSTSLTALAHDAQSQTLVFALCLLAATHSCASVFATARESDSDSRLSFPKRYALTFLTYFALASLAGLLARVAGIYGLAPFLACASGVAVLHFVGCAYAARVHASRALVVPPGEMRATRQESRETFRSAFDHAAIGMALVSPRGQWLQVNRSLCELLGYTEDELLKLNFQNITHPDDIGPALLNTRELLKGKTSTYQSEVRYLRRDGLPVWVLWSVARIVDAESGAVRLIFQVQDITDRKRSEERLLHGAFHDALTGLPNRALFIDHVKLAIARAKRRDNYLFAVLFLDLDRFKVVNDSLGHMIGDQLLVSVARRLEECLRDGDTVARVGGDEFTILLEDLQDEAEAISVVERIQKGAGEPFILDGHEVFTTLSIGIAPSSTDYDDPEDILRDADTAMYRAKTMGKARHEVFDKAMHAFAVNLLQLETDLRKALDRHEFYVLYQPIVSLDDFRLCGFEALVRWQHPERGLISPMDFIPVAEDTGQIIAIGEWTLSEACRQMQRWHRQFPSESPLFMSVNLSSKQFNQPNLIEQVSLILQKTKLDPRCLKLEITESAVMENIDKTTEMLGQLRELGVQLSIDDFGTGYSSLSYLHRFPIDTLKIDRSFVTRMVDNSENIEIVRTIVMLAQVLGMDVVAEGVETKEQLALLRKLGCENGQGYYFSRPTTVSEAEKIISDTCARPQTPLSRQPAMPGALIDDKVKSLRLI
ncbi:MAG: EAL domain-containing protein [Pyrinomonadaceae bacterium]